VIRVQLSKQEVSDEVISLRRALKE